MVIPGFDSPGLATMMSHFKTKTNEKNNFNVCCTDNRYNKRTDIRFRM